MKPYQGDEAKTGQVRTMFDRIAPRYDLLNHLLSFGVDRRWRRRAARAIAAGNPASVLDVACGTGDMAVAIARAVPGAQVTGVDLSPKMAELGNEKMARLGLAARITISVADVTSPGFAAGEYDAVSAAFGVRNFEDLRAGLAGMARALRPGGTMAILEFSMPRSKIIAALYRFYFTRVLPAVGGAISGDRQAYRYLPGSVGEFPAPEAFLEMLREAGLTECRARRMTFGVVCLYTTKKK